MICDGSNSGMSENTPGMCSGDQRECRARESNV